MTLTKLLLKNPISIWLKWMFQAIPLSLKNKTVKFGYMVTTINGKFGNNIAIGDYTELFHSQIDGNTYCGKNCVFIYASIGKFVSIASNVKIGTGIHPVDLVSTSPIFYSTKGQLPQTFAKRDFIEEYKNVTIGNDVWIGENVVVISGVTVGDGCVIAAGAVVTKDTKPYGIYGGVPAKLIKFRFDEKTVEHLIDSNWWMEDFEDLKDKYEEFHIPQNYGK